MTRFPFPPTLLLLAALAGSANAAPVIYEPFDDSDSTISGNTPGNGLTGTWQTSGTTWDLTSPGMTYGSLATSGNKAVNVDSVRGTHGIAFGTALSGAGLLNDGATLWFSFLWKMDDEAVSNGQAAFALGTDIFSGGNNNNMPMTNSGSGIGVFMPTTNGTVSATSWSGGSRSSGGASAWPDRSAPVLIVGEIIWGADALANDTINLYTPGADLALPALEVSSTTAVLDQSLFDTITFGTKREGAPEIDEIRFGSSYEDVVFDGEAAADPLVLGVNPSGGNLDFEWNGADGMQYDLLSSTDLSSDPETWLPYNDGVTTYENLLGNSLSGVVTDGSVRFFVLREEKITPTAP